MNTRSDNQLEYRAPNIPMPSCGMTGESASEPPRSTARILLVEDDPDMRALLQPLLSERWDVEAFADARSALEVARRKAPDLIVSDVVMPGISGYELVRAVRADPKIQQIPILLISSRQSEESVVEAMAAKADDYVEKPFSIQELLSRVESRLEMSRLRQELLNRERESRAQAEAALAQVKTILESIADGFASFDRDWKCTYVNDRALKLARKSRDELLGRRIWDVFPDLTEGRTYGELQRTLTGGVAFEFEEYCPLHDTWYEVHVYPWKDGLALCGYDITERKRAEAERERLLREVERKRLLLEETIQELEEADQRYRAVGELVPFGVWECDAEGGITYLSNSFLEVTGIPLAQCLGFGWAQLLPKESRAQVLTEWRACVERGYVWDYEYLIRDKDGRHRTVLSKGIPLRDSQNRILSWVGIHLDITERSQTATALRRTETRLRRLVEANIFGVFIGNLSGQITYANTAFLKMVGYHAADLSSNFLRWDRITPPEWRMADEKALAELKQTGLCTPFEKEYFHKNETRVPVLVGGALVAEIESPEQTVIAFVLNLTERKRIERALEEARMQLSDYASDLERRVAERTEDWQKIAEQLEAFCYTIAHDLRAPLRAMQGFAQALLDDYGPLMDEHGIGYASRIVAAAQRLDSLIQDLLAYSRLSRADLGFGKVSLDEVIESLLANLAAEIKAKNALIEIVHPLPQVQGHSFTVQQLVWNLVTNALKFVRAGVPPQIRVWAETLDEKIRFWVEDNGIGIAPQYQDRIFKVFERLHTTEAYPGTGIGLAIVRKGAERMGGRVGVVSEVGKGSRFWIDFQKPPPNSHEAL